VLARYPIIRTTVEATSKIDAMLITAEGNSVNGNKHFTNIKNTNIKT
jgi:hypothetical protein